MNILKRKAGFTIIELMVSVAIIAILTAIITANLASSKSKSRDAKRVSDIAQLQLALELFFDRCNRYPIKETTLSLVPGWTDAPKLLDTGNGCPTNITLQTFMTKIPTPQTTGDYRYNPDDNATPLDYVLQAKLENKNAALQDDMDAPPSTTVAGTRWTTTNITGLICTDTTSGWYYCVQPR